MQPKKSLVLTAIAASVMISACNNSNDKAAVQSNLLLDNNRIAYLDAASPASSLDVLGTVTGLNVGDTLVSIDRRPENGFLYGLGYNALAATVTLYVIHPETRVATPVGVAGTFTTDGINPVAIGGSNPATRFEMDFNPAVDRVRVINDMGQNFRINPNTGAVVDGDLGGSTGSVSGTNMDGNLNTGAIQAQGTAYVNNVANNGGTTTQYTVGESPSALYIQNPPNAGTLTSAATLSPLIKAVLGFDIAPGVNTVTSNAAVTSGSGYLLLRTGTSTPEALARLNLVTGQLSDITEIVGGASARGIAVQAPESRAMIGLSSDGSQLVRFAEATPGTTTQVAIIGVTLNESLVGIDFRPATGQLLALGVNAGANTGTVYRLDPQTGAATVIGTASSVAFVGSDGITAVDLPDPATERYGIDFNPTVDRIRVTTSTGLNFRLNPVTGAAVDGSSSAAGTNPDGAINGSGITGVSEVAYTNSVAGTTATTLYAFTSPGAQLSIQNPPNNGTLTLPLTVKLNGNTLAITRVNGFDIPSDVRATASDTAVSKGSGLAALTVGGLTGLYRIELPSAAATSLGTIGSGLALRGLAVGQTHAR